MTIDALLADTGATSPHGKHVVQGRASRRPGPGAGYLAGSLPDGITSVLGVPSSATIRVIYRPAAGALADGVVVAEAQSGLDGTWVVEGLDPALRFDVVCRKEGYNDLVWANVQPSAYPPLSLSGGFTPDATTFALQGAVNVTGQQGELRVEVLGISPPGISFSVSGGTITASGNCTVPGSYSWSLKVIDQRHNQGVIDCSVADLGSGDFYYPLVRSLLHLDGSEGATSFPDVVLGGSAWGAGGTAIITAADGKFGGSCLLLDGGGWLGTTSDPFNFAAMDFTLEMQVKMAAYPASFTTLAYLNGNTTTYAQLRLDISSDGKLGLLAGIASASWVTTDVSLYQGGTLPLGTWAFIRCGRRAGAMFAEIDGTQVISYPISPAQALYNYAGPTMFGGYASGSSALGRSTAKLDEIRITRGVGRSGPAPTAPFPYPST